MNSENASLTPTPKEMTSSRSAGRTTVITMALLAGLATVLIGVPWLFYRLHHVVISQARVRGTVTKLGARLDGQIKDIFVEPGQRVHRDQVLLRLDDRHLQAIHQRALAEQEAATNALVTEELSIQEDRRRLTLEMERADSLRRSAAAAIEGAQSAVDKLDKDYTRIAQLMKEGIAASSDMDQVIGQRGQALAELKAARARRDAAVSSYDTARAQLEALRVRESHLGMLKAQVDIARANVAVAEADLEATLLRAPADGWVVDRIVEVGGSAKVGEPMLSLWIGDPWVEAWADEENLQRLNVGSPVKVSLAAYSGRTLRGRIEAFGLLSNKELADHGVPSDLNALIRKNALVPIRISVECAGLRLQPGLSAVVGIEKSPEAPNAAEETIFSWLLSKARQLPSNPLAAEK